VGWCQTLSGVVELRWNMEAIEGPRQVLEMMGGLGIGEQLMDEG
jgi:hypothetical protein